jgi:hypothetical protein
MSPSVEDRLKNLLGNGSSRSSSRDNLVCPSDFIVPHPLCVLCHGLQFVLRVIHCVCWKYTPEKYHYYIRLEMHASRYYKFFRQALGLENELSTAMSLFQKIYSFINIHSVVYVSYCIRKFSFCKQNKIVWNPEHKIMKFH